MPPTTKQFEESLVGALVGGVLVGVHELGESSVHAGAHGLGELSEEVLNAGCRGAEDQLNDMVHEGSLRHCVHIGIVAPCSEGSHKVINVFICNLCCGSLLFFIFFFLVIFFSALIIIISLSIIINTTLITLIFGAFFLLFIHFVIISHRPHIALLVSTLCGRLFDHLGLHFSELTLPLRVLLPMECLPAVPLAAVALPTPELHLLHLEGYCPRVAVAAGGADLLCRGYELERLRVGITLERDLSRLLEDLMAIVAHASGLLDLGEIEEADAALDILSLNVLFIVHFLGAFAFEGFAVRGAFVTRLVEDRSSTTCIGGVISVGAVSIGALTNESCYAFIRILLGWRGAFLRSDYSESEVEASLLLVEACLEPLVSGFVSVFIAFIGNMLLYCNWDRIRMIFSGSSNLALGRCLLECGERPLNLIHEVECVTKKILNISDYDLHSVGCSKGVSASGSCHSSEFHLL